MQNMHGILENLHEKSPWRNTGTQNKYASYLP